MSSLKKLMSSMKKKLNKSKNTDKMCFKTDGADILALWVSKLSRNKLNLVCFS